MAASQKVHIAVTRRVKPGFEAQFEREIGEFLEESRGQPGTADTVLIRPFGASSMGEYSILRAFDDAAAMDGFYQSERYVSWNRRVAPLVEGEPDRRELSGFSAFFGKPAAPPATWKMAFVTWLGVNPAVYLSVKAVQALGLELPMLVELLVTNVLVVAILTWAVMPVLTRVFRGWLQPEPAAGMS